MYGNKRKCMLQIFDYSNNVVCTLFDNFANVSGQAENVIVSTQKNGWKQLKFTIPSKINTQNGIEDNYRLQFLKADYKIRMLDDSDDGVDWYIISQPRITHNAFSKNVQVTAGHVSQVLKTKNMSLQFSKEKNNNVGTAKELLTRILEGTDWVVGQVYDFGEKDGTEKKRTLNESIHTGCFKMITDMCKLFDAKPVYHGQKTIIENGVERKARVVDIVPVNPFSKPEDGQLPDMDSELTKKVFQLNYGSNVSQITRSLSTQNLITKLYAYGSYGTKTYGYCSIDECTHLQYEFTCSNTINAGDVCYFSSKDNGDTSETIKHFTATKTVPAGNKLIYSYLDPCSQMYIWDEFNQTAYFVSANQQNATKHLTADNPSDKDNVFAFVMDYDYYRKVGLLSDEILQTIATYQRNAPESFKAASAASLLLSKAKSDLAEIIGGNINTCRLAVSSIDSNAGYMRINLNTNDYEDGIMYRTDYDKPKESRFTWIKTDSLDSRGDPINSGASMIYIIHGNGDYPTWDKFYLKDLNDNKNPTQLTFWAKESDIAKCNTNDHFFLFQYNGINGYLGSLEAGDESAVMSLEDLTTVVTMKHNVYFADSVSATWKPDQTINNYAWRWVYDKTNSNNSKFYFSYPADFSDDNGKWRRTYFGSKAPSSASTNDYFYNWKTSTLYRYSGSWIALTTYAQRKVSAYFGAVYSLCMQRDRLYIGLADVYIHYITGSETGQANMKLPVGNYFFETPYHLYWAFSTDKQLDKNSYIAYNTKTGLMTEGVSTNYTDDSFLTTDSVIQMKTYRYDAVQYHKDNVFSITDNTKISFTTGIIDSRDGIVWDPQYETEEATDANGNAYKKIVTKQATINGVTKKMSQFSRTQMFIPVVPNTTYRYSGSQKIYIYNYDAKYGYIRLTGGTVPEVSNGGTYTTNDSTFFIRIVVAKSVDDANNLVSSISMSAVNMYESDGSAKQIIIQDVCYNRLDCVPRLVVNGTIGNNVPANTDLIGIINCVAKMRDLFDHVYIDYFNALNDAQAATTRLENNMTSAIGDLYREEFWNDQSYVDGDEKKLYTDALQRLRQMAKPQTKYSIGYLDLYESNKQEYGTLDEDGFNWPDVDITSPIHLIDDELDINEWAFVQRINKCYDQPWKTTLDISTNITNFYAHTMSDVLTNITESAMQMKTKTSIYDSYVNSGDSLPVAEIAAIVNNVYVDAADKYNGSTQMDGSARTSYTLSTIADGFSGLSISIQNDTGGGGGNGTSGNSVNKKPNQIEALNTINTQNNQLVAGLRTSVGICQNGIYEHEQLISGIRAKSDSCWTGIYNSDGELLVGTKSQIDDLGRKINTFEGDLNVFKGVIKADKSIQASVIYTNNSLSIDSQNQLYSTVKGPVNNGDDGYVTTGTVNTSTLKINGSTVSIQDITCSDNTKKKVLCI